MTQQYRGACMCGTVQFTYSGSPRFVGECVCESCRRAHGASVVGWLGGPASLFRIDQGEPELKWYRSSRESERGFCRTCGTRILFRSSKWPEEMHMALAAIESPHDLMSSGVAFREEFPPWSAMTVPPSP